MCKKKCKTSTKRKANVQKSPSYLEKSDLSSGESDEEDKVVTNGKLVIMCDTKRKLY